MALGVLGILQVLIYCFSVKSSSSVCSCLAVYLLLAFTFQQERTMLTELDRPSIVRRSKEHYLDWCEKHEVSGSRLLSISTRHAHSGAKRAREHGRKTPPLYHRSSSAMSPCRDLLAASSSPILAFTFWDFPDVEIIPTHGWAYSAALSQALLE
jgi:hypothetical protein